jgi:hypothetical protein
MVGNCHIWMVPDAPIEVQMTGKSSAVASFHRFPHNGTVWGLKSQ